MRKFLKTLATVVIVVAVLMLVISIAINFLVNPARLKKRLGEYFQTHYHRQIAINGDLVIHIFPWVHLTAQKIQISNPDNFGFNDQPLLQAKELNIGIKILPLLRKHYEIGTVMLNDLQVNLITDAKGNINWQFASDNKNPNQALLPLVLIDNLAITNANIHWLNKASNQDYRVNHFMFTTKGVAPNTAFPINLSGDIYLNANSPNNHFDVASSIVIDPNRQTIKFPDFKFTFNEVKFTGTVDGANVTTPKQNFVLTGKTNVFNFKNVASKLGLAAANNLNFDHMRIALTAKSDANSTVINPLVINLDEGTFKGSVTMPLTGQAANSAVSEGMLALKSYKFNNLKLTNVELPIIAKNNIVTINPLRAQAYQGNYVGQVNIDMSNPMMKVSSQGALSNVKIEDLLKDLSPKSKFQVSGIATLNPTVTTSGTDANTLLQNLNGQMLFALNNGVLSGIDLAYYFSIGNALFKKETKENVTNTGKTNFGNLTGVFTITQGVATTDNLLLQGGNVLMKGRGSANLVTNRLDFNLEIRASTANSIMIPVRVTGTFDNPSIKPDVGQLISDQAKKQLLDQIGKQLGVDKNNLNDQLQNALGNLLK